MGKENPTPTNVTDDSEKTAEEIANAKRLELLNGWLDWIEKQNGGVPAAILVKESLVKKPSQEEKTDSE